MEVDLLFFGAHPDDVEIGAGGILARHAGLGYRCGIIDLTAGEMASSGTPEERREEAAKAADLLQCTFRRCLMLPDARLSVNKESLARVSEVLRALRPKIVLAPYFKEDRHPDHNAAGELLRRSVYLSGLKGLPLSGEAFQPQRLYFYLLSADRSPDVIVDITSVYDLKERALSLHQTQFQRDAEGNLALVNDPHFLRFIRSRDSYFGSLIGASWGEGLIAHEKPRAWDLVKWSSG